MAPRDGLQVLNRRARIPLDERVALVGDLQRAGLPYVEAGAFVSPRRVPAMADTAELLARCRRGGLAALCPNMKYYNKLRESPHLDTVALFVSASEPYSRRNTRMGVDEALTAAAEVARAARADGYAVRAHVSGAFRDLTPDDRPTEAAVVVRVVERLREAAPGMEVALADTDGRATSEDVERVLGALADAVGLEGIGVHLHDREGRALEHARRAWRVGVRVFDAAVGGVGGNPTALDDCVGNLATEALVRLLEDELGVRTGIDWDALIDAGARVTAMARAVGDPPPPSPVLARALRERAGSAD